MPCLEWFDAQDRPTGDGAAAEVKARVSVEAGVAQGWRDVVGDAGRASRSSTSAPRADYQTLLPSSSASPPSPSSTPHARAWPTLAATWPTSDRPATDTAAPTQGGTATALRRTPDMTRTLEDP